MKILYYNWIQFDNKNNIGGGVNVYQRNLIDYFVNNTNHEIYFLSSGWHYNFLKKEPYIRETKNIYNGGCKSFEIINSTIMAPAGVIFMNPELFISDTITEKLFDEFLSKHGPFDVVHLNNIEGISINVLSLKEKYPNTKFVVSIHNYQSICPLVQYFQSHNNVICNDFKNGSECLKCSLHYPSKKEYSMHCKNYFYSILPDNQKLLKFILKHLSKLFDYRTKKYIGSSSNMLPHSYANFREYNITMLNKYADSILAVSERVREIMIANGINPEKITTSYIGTKFAEKELNKSIALSTKPFTIAYLGYERIDKGFFFFIEALSKLDKSIAQNINIVLAVSKIHRKNYIGKLDNFNNVTVYNGYTHSNISNILKNVNLGVVPVLWEDNLPQVAIEMVALGVPILCSNFGGASELCNCDLFKFKGGDEQDFLSKLTKLVNNPHLTKEYWKNHSPLTTMKKHAEELEIIYQ